MNVLRQYVREHSTLERREQVSALRRRLRGRTASVIAALLSKLPVPVQGAVRDRSKSTARLDYSRGEIRIVVDSEIEATMRANSCAKEPETVAWIQDSVGPDDVFYDIGANIGAYSLVVDAWTKGRARVFAFEAGYQNFVQLNRNVVLNSARRIVPLYVALSDKTEMGSFSHHSLTPGSSLHSLDGPTEAVYVQPIPMHRLDDFIAQFDLPRPTHIKLDVDGIEFAILNGAESTLAAGSVVSLMLEVEEGRPGSDEIEPWLRRLGYRLEAAYPRPGRGSATANCVFIRTGKGAH